MKIINIKFETLLKRVIIVSVIIAIVIIIYSFYYIFNDKMNKNNEVIKNENYTVKIKIDKNIT